MGKDGKIEFIGHPASTDLEAGIGKLLNGESLGLGGGAGAEGEGEEGDYKVLDKEVVEKELSDIQAAIAANKGGWKEHAGGLAQAVLAVICEELINVESGESKFENVIVQAFGGAGAHVNADRKSVV